MSGWAEIRDELRRRIAERVWAPGDPLPNETALAAEFGVARATVNRALQSLAQTGLVERRRRAGTRVALLPSLRATVDIPVIRREVEAAGMTHAHEVEAREVTRPPASIDAEMALGGAAALHLVTRHDADGAPFALETRWINLAAAPAARDHAFADVSANEWLVRNCRYSRADIAFSAHPATGRAAALFGPGAAVFTLNRTTWDGDVSVTAVEIGFHPGYRMRTGI